MCTAVLIGWDLVTPPPPRIWAHIRGRYWSAKIDEITLWPPDSDIWNSVCCYPSRSLIESLQLLIIRRVTKILIPLSVVNVKSSLHLYGKMRIILFVACRVMDKRKKRRLFTVIIFLLLCRQLYHHGEEIQVNMSVRVSYFHQEFLKGTQDWEFVWLRLWNLRYFFVSYVKILRFYKKKFLIGPLTGRYDFSA